MKLKTYRILFTILQFLCFTGSLVVEKAWMGIGYGLMFLFCTWAKEDALENKLNSSNK